MEPLDAAAAAAYLGAPPTGRRAVVIGASLAGLLAARVLAEHFDEVLLVDRGELPDGDAHRKVTPHTRHAHGLLASGKAAMEALFPGIREEWLAPGGRVGDMQQQIAFYAGRRRFASGVAGEEAIAVGRVVIEGAVRRRVLALANVRAASGLEVDGLVLDEAAGAVRGIRLRSSDRAVAVDAPAALVVDASGRGSRLPQWLRGFGYDAPEEDKVQVDIHYATAYFERSEDDASGLEAVLCAATPDCPLPAVMVGQEGGRWVVTLGGYGRDVPPLDRAGFVARAQRLAPELAAVVARGRFVADPIPYRFPHSQRRRYERLARFPAGLLAFGDAISSFNPIYGQGMSVAGCEALALRDCLAAGDHALAPRFFARAAKIVDIAWNTAVGADLSIPSVEGPRPLPVRLINAYVARVFEAAQHDPQVARAFLRVAHLLEPPPSLMAPRMLARVAGAAWRRRRGATAAVAAAGAA